MEIQKHYGSDGIIKEYSRWHGFSIIPYIPPQVSMGNTARGFIPSPAQPANNGYLPTYTTGYSYPQGYGGYPGAYSQPSTYMPPMQSTPQYVGNGSNDGGYVDPATGLSYAINPLTGMPIDPNTGYDIDLSTGQDIYN